MLPGPAHPAEEPLANVIVPVDKPFLPNVETLFQSGLRGRAVVQQQTLAGDDGDQAISLLEDDVYKDRIKLVLCDWNMPNTTGLDVLRWIRESDYHKSLPFIMVTAEGMKKNIVDRKSND